MYLQKLALKNFRSFSDEKIIAFNRGLNVLVGENDSGKSAIIDAIRIVMGTTDQGWYHIEASDFYNENMESEIHITLTFADLSEEEQASFLECLSYVESSPAEDGAQEVAPCLIINWSCKYLMGFAPPRTFTTITSGISGDGPAPSAAARELLRVTYLRPLRDSYSNMQSGRNSRLSQIIQGIPEIDSGEEYSEGTDLRKLSLSGIVNLSNKLLSEHPKLKDANNIIAGILNDKMLLRGDDVKTSFEVAGADAPSRKKLISLLEKLDLSTQSNTHMGKVGLGTSNILSMACELLLNRHAGSSFLLIEEPEAHIHAQRQLRLIQSLQEESNGMNVNQQIIVTTHSPLLASVVNVENITIIKSSKAYSLARDKTNLDGSDYAFLEKYLDSTKANLFFAKAVMMVEGPSEELLIPTIAKILGKDLTEYGISIVNVRGIGMRRFARIFQRKDENDTLNINVACITDRDIMPDCAPGRCIDSLYEDQSEWPEKSKRKWRAETDFPREEDKARYRRTIVSRADGQGVKTFVSDHWTFEYDLAFAGLHEELIDAIVKVNYVPDNQPARKTVITDKFNSLETKEEKCAYLYNFFAREGTSKADVAQQMAAILEEKYSDKKQELELKLPNYIKSAIAYLTEGI